MQKRITYNSIKFTRRRLNLDSGGIQRQQVDRQKKIALQSRRRSLTGSVLEVTNPMDKKMGSGIRKLRTEAAERSQPRPTSSNVSRHDEPPFHQQSPLPTCEVMNNMKQMSRDRQRCLTQPQQNEQEGLPDCRLNEDKDFTEIKVINANFSHHNSGMCVCNLCDCGRHLCKLHVVKPELHPRTIYNTVFRGDPSIMKLKIKPKSETQPLEGPHLSLNSVYEKDYDKKEVKGERPRPSDQLSTGGPSASLSSYAAQFPGFKGVNQYVKPTNNTNLSGILQFGRSGTVYQKAYVPLGRRITEKLERRSYFKTGDIWLGKSTYKQSFGPNSSGGPSPSHKSEEKFQRDPNFQHQYGNYPPKLETTYQNEYKPNGSVACPAKLKLQTFGLESTKLKMSENAEFKLLKPHVIPISLTNFQFN